jgi:predicted dinucleotide-binding enzyme
MRIAVIGAGRIGGTIGGKWEAAGHDVVYGLRDPGKKNGAKPIAEALNGADAVLLAIAGSGVGQVAHDNGKGLDHKIVIDATNDVGGKSLQHWDLLREASPNVRLYRAFNTYGFEVFADASLGGARPDLFYAGPDGDSKQKVEQLIKDVGLNPVWVGGPDAVDVVDGVLRLWFTLARRLGRRIAFRLITD